VLWLVELATRRIPSATQACCAILAIPVLLDSAAGIERFARYSILACWPPGLRYNPWPTSLAGYP